MKAMKFLLLLLAAVSGDHHLPEGHGPCGGDCAETIFQEIWRIFADDGELAKGLSAQDAAVYAHLLWKNWTFLQEDGEMVGEFAFVVSTMELIGASCGLSEGWERREVVECWSDEGAADGMEYWLSAECDDSGWDNGMVCADEGQRAMADAYRWIAGVLANHMAPGKALANAYSEHALTPEQINEGVQVLYTYGFIHHAMDNNIIDQACLDHIIERVGYTEGQDDIFITIAGNQDAIKSAGDDAKCAAFNDILETVGDDQKEATKEWALGAFQDRVETFAVILEMLDEGTWDDVDKALVGYFTFMEPSWEWVMTKIGETYEIAFEEEGPSSSADMTKLVDAVTDEWINQSKTELAGLTDELLWEHSPHFQMMHINAADVVASYKRVIGTISKRFASSFDNALVKWVGGDALNETQVNGAIAGYQTFKTISDSPMLQVLVTHQIDENFWDMAEFFDWSEETGWDQFVGDMFAAGAYILDEVKKEVTGTNFDAAAVKEEAVQKNQERVDRGDMTQAKADEEEEALEAFVAAPLEQIQAIEDAIDTSATDTVNLAEKFTSDNTAKEEAEAGKQEEKEPEDTSSAAIVSAAVAFIALLL